MEKKKIKLSLRMVVLMFFFILVVPSLPLLITRHWDWWEAWAYAVISILGFVVSRWLAARKNPDILAERAGSLEREDAKPWDKKLVRLVGLFSMLIPVVIGVDVLLHGRPVFGQQLRIVALVILLVGYVLGSWALIANRFFSGVVRIQTDRGQHVVDSGPYRWVRHPGYADALLVYLATPFFLDSLWAFLPVVLTMAVLVYRTSLEDKTLHEELEGYREYAARVRYRLLPGIW